MDKYIRVKNCNCISDATIEIVEKSLNIKYGSNGTGKSTISEAIYAQANNETDRLKDFKPYGSNDNSQPTVDNPYFHVVKVFNEDYVNSYLFQGDEFLDDSFQVFLKSDKCDSLAAQIERMLEELQDLINNIDAIHNLRTFLPQYTAAVKASDGTVSRRGGVAEFVNGNGGGFNHYSELKAYKPFYSRDLPSVAKWAKWRNDGIKQMCGNDCPFCTNILPSSIRSQNEIISKVFKNSALSVANAVLEYVQQAVDQGYILPDAVDVLESYIGDNTKADELYAELQMLAKETDYLYKKIEKICMFKPMNVTHAQLVNLEQSLSELVIEERQLQSFYATDLIKKLNKIYDLVIVDECSTVCNEDILQLFEKCNSEAYLLLGDIHQIEAIKFGNWFNFARYFIEKNSVYELSIPYRAKNNNTLLDMWSYVRHYDENMFERLQANGYISTLDESIFEKTEDEIILCLGYDGLYGVNNINRYMQKVNPSNPVEWGNWVYKVGDKVLFNDNKRFGSVLYNNLKGTIVTIDRKDEEIVFQIQIDKKISDRDIFYTDLKLHDCACEGKSIVEFSVKKRIEKDSDTDYSEQVVPFQIAYAVSIHKAQGLEYKSVKVVITEDVDEQISHNIFYTAITRTTDKLKIYLSKETQKKLATKFVESNVGLKQAQIFAQHAGLKLKNKLSS